jgi:Tfp pilus assembly protein PilO
MKGKQPVPETIFGMETDLAKILVLPFVIFVAFIVVILGVAVPKFGEIKEMNQKADELTKKRNQVIEKKNYVMSVDQNDLKRNVVLLNNSLLREKNWYYLVSVVNKVAQSYGFQIDSFSVKPGNISGNAEPGSKQAKTGVAKIPVDLVMLGPQKSYLEFVLALEKTLPLLVVDSFEMKNNGEISQLNLTVSSYYVEEKNSLPSANLSLTDLTLRKEENEVLKTLWTFNNVMESEDKLEAAKKFVKYQRTNPFSL